MSNRTRVAAAEALGVNYRTMVASYESRRVRRAPEEYRDAGVDAGDLGEIVASLEQHVAALEKENRVP